MRIALGLEYDGRSFSGWQSQPTGGTVQDALERALSIIAGEPIRVIAAGRTDAGVHASMQVVHFDTAAMRPDMAWVRGVNSHLPHSVAVQWARPVDEQFHARFSARGRSYRYVLFNHPVRPALLHGRAGWCHNPLNLELMQRAASLLVGSHDFSAFRAAECQAKSPIKQLKQLDISRGGYLIHFDLHADAFLHHMVRNLVGSLVHVGKGRQTPDWLAQVLESRDRSKAAATFAPDGLYLNGVEYAEHWGLPAMPTGWMP